MGKGLLPATELFCFCTDMYGERETLLEVYTHRETTEANQGFTRVQFQVSLWPHAIQGFTESGICYTGPESPDWMFCAVTSSLIYLKDILTNMTLVIMQWLSAIVYIFAKKSYMTLSHLYDSGYLWTSNVQVLHVKGRTVTAKKQTMAFLWTISLFNLYLLSWKL